MTASALVARDGDHHLSPRAYYALAVLASLVGLAASYVTIRLFALAIQQGESDGPARELLTLAAVLFVAAELAAVFIAGLLPVQRLRALRWQLTVCAVVLLAFEAVSLYGARVTLAQASESRAGAAEGRARQLRASIEANRSAAAALIAAGQRSSQSLIATSRADGAQSLRDAAALEAATARLTAELAQLEAARAPTPTAVFGESGVIALAVTQSLLVSGIGLVFLGAAGVLVRSARDVAGAAASLHRAVSIDASVDTRDAAPSLQADAVTATRRAPLAVEQFQALPRGAVAAVPTWGRSALAAGAGLVSLATAPAQAAQTPEPPVPAPTSSTPQPPAASTTASPPASVSLHPPASPAASTPSASTSLPADTATPASRARRPAAARAASVRDADDEADAARFLRVRAGIEAGRIKPTIRAIYAAEGASQTVATRYLLTLEQAGVIRRAGRGYALRDGPSVTKADQA
jgi:hypothetical protein